MRKKLIDLLIAAQDLTTLSRKADFLIANDVVPVVRCKNCKWAYRDKYSGCYFCHERQVRCDHFCSYGERKDNESSEC